MFTRSSFTTLGSTLPLSKGLLITIVGAVFAGCAFSNITVPVPQPGGTTGYSGSVELTLQKPDGKVLYDRSSHGSGNSYCLTGECAFGTATKEALTEVINKIVEACSSEEFRQALKT